MADSVPAAIGQLKALPGNEECEIWRNNLLPRMVFRVNPELRRDIQQIADEEQGTITQVCEMLLHEGVEGYKKEGPSSCSA